MKHLLTDRNARLYIGGQTLSTIGDSSLWLAMGIWVKILTGSNSAAGLVFFAFTCGLLLSPFCGVVVDRLPRRPLLAVANLAGAALVCTLLLVHGRDQIWLIYAVMFGYGVTSAAIGSAQTALLPALVPGELLGEANALLQAGSQGTRILSPLIGAGLLAWLGAQPVVLLDAATFLAAALTVAALRLPGSAVPTRAGWRDEFTAGLRYIARTPALRRLLVTAVLVLAVFGFMETVCFAIVSQGLHRPAPFLGVLVAVQAAGSIAGAAAAGPLLKRASERTLIAVGLSICAAACLLLLAGVLPVVLAACVALGACLVWVNVGVITLIQRRTPAGLIGRVDSALTLAATVPQALSIAAGAALIAVVGYRALLAAMAVVTAAAVVYLVREPAATVPATAAGEAGAGEAGAGEAGAGEAGSGEPAEGGPGEREAALPSAGDGQVVAP